MRRTLASLILLLAVSAFAQEATSPYRGKLKLRSTVVTSGPVVLTHGEYRAPPGSGAAGEVAVRLTDKIAFGGASANTAAIVVQSSLGGSGTFYELALFSRQPSGWVNTDTVRLGDRVKVGAVAFEGNAVVLDMAVHAPGDPMCCPSAQERRRYEIRDGRLEAVRGEAGATTQVAGAAWQWKDAGR